MNKNKKIDVLVFLLLVVIIGFFGINFFVNHKIEQRISKYNGYEAPKDSFYKGMKFTFSDVNCRGILKHKCMVNNPIITLNNEKIIAAKNIVLNNVESFSFDIKKGFIDFKINKLEIFNRLKLVLLPTELNNKEAKQKAKKLYSDLFPLDFSFKTAFLKTNENEIIGKTHFYISNKIFELNSGSKIKKIRTKDFYTIYVDKNGSILKNAKPNIMIGEYKLPQKEYTLVPKINYSLKDKGIIDFIYTYYVVQLKENPFLIKEINNVVFGLTKKEILTKKEFQDIFTKRMEEFQKEIPYKITKKIATFAIDIINNKHKTLFVKGEFKNNKEISVEAILLLTQKLHIPFYKIFEEYYKYKIKIHN